MEVAAVLREVSLLNEAEQVVEEEEVPAEAVVELLVPVLLAVVKEMKTVKQVYPRQLRTLLLRLVPLPLLEHGVLEIKRLATRLLLLELLVPRVVREPPRPPNLPPLLPRQSLPFCKP